jgi:peptidoglycan/LPS O-acetylase OafA/YrhL
LKTLWPTGGDNLIVARTAPNFTIHTTLPLPAAIRQIDGLQILRAAAVFLVAWLHAGQILGSNELPHFGAFGIDIFFVISGFIISSVLLRTQQAPGAHATWGFLKRRLIRIFPIYWFFALLESARLLHGHGFSLQNCFPGFLLLPNLYPRYPLIVGFSWTLIFEMFFYYVLSAILLVTVKQAVPVSIAFFGASILLGRIVGIQRPVWIIVCNPMLLEFIFGAAIALFYIRFGKARKLGIAMVILGVAISLYLRAYPEFGGATGISMVLAGVEVMRRVLTWGLAATMIVAGVIFWSPAIRTQPGKISVILGNASYSAYLASSLIMEFTTRLLVKPGDNLPPPLGKLAVLQSALVIAVFAGGWICYQCVEWPMIRWLRSAGSRSIVTHSMTELASK